MAKVPRAKNQYKSAPDSAVGSKTKYETIEKAGFTPKQVERFQTLAAHPEIVAQAKAEARENDEGRLRHLRRHKKESGDLGVHKKDSFGDFGGHKK